MLQDAATVMLVRDGSSCRLEHVSAIQPRLVGHGDGLRVLLPGDPGYDEAGAPAAEPWPSRPGAQEGGLR